MSGGDRSLALEQTVIGNKLLPVTVMPIFVFVAALGTPMNTSNLSTG